MKFAWLVSLQAASFAAFQSPPEYAGLSALCALQLARESRIAAIKACTTALRAPIAALAANTSKTLQTETMLRSLRRVVQRAASPRSAFSTERVYVPRGSQTSRDHRRRCRRGCPPRPRRPPPCWAPPRPPWKLNCPSTSSPWSLQRKICPAGVQPAPVTSLHLPLGKPLKS